VNNEGNVGLVSFANEVVATVGEKISLEYSVLPLIGAVVGEA